MKRIIFLIAGLVAMLSLIGCAQESKKPLKLVSIAFQEWVGYGPLYLAKEKGFFKDEGIDLFIVDEQLDSGRRDAFKAGILDCEAGTIDLLVSKVAQDTPIIGVMELDRSFGGDAIVVDSHIKSLGDLAGKRVALARDDVGETFLSYILLKEDIALDRLKIISNPPEKVAEVFLNKGADAVVTWEPWVSKALEKPGAHILISTKDVPGVVIDTLNIREDIVRNNPQVVKAMMRAWFRGVKYYQAHTEEASSIIAKYYNISPKQYRKNVSGLIWSGHKEQIKPENIKARESVFDNIALIKFNNNRIAKIPQSKKAIDSKLIKEIYENSK